MIDRSPSTPTGANGQSLEGQYRALVEGSPDVIMRFDHSGRHLFVSPSVSNIVPMEPAEFIGKTHRELGFPEEMCNLWEAQIGKVLQTDAPVECTFDLDLEKGRRTFDWRLAPEHDTGGELVGVLGFARDITDQFQAARDYEYVFNQMLDGMAVHEMIFDGNVAVDYRFLSVNPAFERLTGMCADDIIGRRVMEVFPETEQHWIDLYAKVVTTGEHARFENYTQALGKHFEVVAFRNQPGQFACIFQDITAQVKGTQALSESEERFRLLFEESTDAIFIHDLDGTIINVNSQACRILGWERNELCSMHISDLHPPSEQERGKEAVGTVIRDGTCRFQSTMIRQDGSLLEVDISASRLLHDGNAVQGIVRDISAQKSVESELKRERDFNSAILNTACALIAVLDRDGCVIRFNKACENTTGFTFEEVRGKCLWDILVVPEERAAVAHIWGHRGLSTFPSMIEGRWLTKSGRSRLIAWSNSSLDNDFVVSVGIDITEQRGAENRAALRQEQLIRADKLASLGTLVAGMAHEINNPNNFIMMNIGTLQEIWQGVRPILDQYREEHGEFNVASLPYSEVDENLSELFAGMNDGADRIRRIVQDLRRYARDDSADMAQSVDISAAMEHALGLLRNVVNQSTHRLTICLEPEMPLIRGNNQRVEQVFVNVLQNACQALPDVGCGIRVGTHHDRASQTVVAVVGDEGVGIPRDRIKDVTDPFFTTKRDVGGTGLGLSICARIMQEHNGSISFESQPNKGTVVTMSFPALAPMAPSDIDAPAVID